MIMLPYPIFSRVNMDRRPGWKQGISGEAEDNRSRGVARGCSMICSLRKLEFVLV